MKTIKNSKEITTLEVGDVIVFGNMSHTVKMIGCRYYLYNESTGKNDHIIKDLCIDIPSFNKKLGIECDYDRGYSECSAFPEYYSLEALTAIVSALFKEYEKQNELPKTWEEFCEKYPIKAKEAYITTDSEVCNTFNGVTTFNSNLRHYYFDKNLCTSKQEAEAFLALMQLRQLRKAYVKDWEPDWKNGISAKYCIAVDSNELLIDSWYHKSHILSFPSRELAEQFLTNFKDLLEIAKPLL